MNSTICLSNQLVLMAVEISDIPTDWMLTTEFKTTEPSVAQTFPKYLFCGSRMFTELPAEFHYVRRYLPPDPPRSPCPFPKGPLRGMGPRSGHFVTPCDTSWRDVEGGSWGETESEAVALTNQLYLSPQSRSPTPLSSHDVPNPSSLSQYALLNLLRDLG